MSDVRRAFRSKIAKPTIVPKIELGCRQEAHDLAIRGQEQIPRAIEPRFGMTSWPGRSVFKRVVERYNGPTPMPLAPGTKLGPYEIQSPLGAGGMGEVYRARDTRLDRTVAVKILPSHLSTSPEAKQRFEREARVISSLNHSNICTLHDVGDQDGISYLVMEYVQGDTLESRLQKGPLPLKQAWNAACRSAMHSRKRIAPASCIATSSPETSC